jgi:medium-chain acyl-[acyl-carrier-protein] hydrolase
MEPGPVTPWIARGRSNPRAALRLLCFPYAGGGASIFRTWPDALPAEVELWRVELPGRETRVKEAPFQQLAPLLASLVDAIAGHLEAPFAIYGHSFGALLGFSFARELRRRSLGAPVHLFVSGRRAPQLSEPSPMRQLPDPEFLARLRRLGGIPDAVFDEPELIAYFLPTLRADIAVNETAMPAQEAPLACPITALGGLTDDRASATELDAWHAQTSAAFEREMFPGGHFFLQSERTALLASLSRRLSRITAAL